MNRRIVLIAGGAVAVLALWFLLLWSPKGDEISAAKEREAAALAQASELELRLARLVELKKHEPELQGRLSTLEAAIPTEAELGPFIIEANDAARAAGVEFLSITPTPPSPSTNPGVASQVQLGLTVDGGYHQVLDYLDRLLSLRRIVVVDQISVAPGDGGRLGVTLTGRMFSSGPADAAAAPAGATAPAPAPAPTEQVAAASTAGGAS